MAQSLPPHPLPRPKSSLWPRMALSVVALDLLGLYVYLGRRDYLLNPVWIYLALYTLLFVGYVYAAGRLVPQFRKTSAGWLLPLILIFGVLFRAAVLPAPPSISTDMYRYVWDGRLTMHGINPYRWTPNAQTLRSLRDPIWRQMEYKPYQTIYMPVSQLFFALGNALFGNKLVGFKTLYALFDCGVIALGMLLLKRLGRPVTQIIWYAWCPLPITEVALAGHQDVVGVFFLLATFALVLRPKTVAWAAVTLVAATLTKGFALVLLPLFCRTYGVRFTIIAACAMLYLGMPMWVYLPEFLHGMTQYLDSVHANAGLFHGVDMLLLPITRYHYEITQKLADLMIVAVAAWSVWRPVQSFNDLLRRSFIVLAVTLLVVPTLFPWYLLWTLPLTAVISRRPSWAFILLTGLVGLLYTYYISILTYWWIPLAEYVPFYLVLLLEYRSRRGLWSPLPSSSDQILPIVSWPLPSRRAGKTPDTPHGRSPA
jgi:alpha-1,6-mannosyltransferase